MSPVLQRLELQSPPKTDALTVGSFFSFFSSVLTVGFRSAQAEQVAQWKLLPVLFLSYCFTSGKLKPRVGWFSEAVFCLEPATSLANINTNLPLDRKECAPAPVLCTTLLEENVCFPDTAIYAYNPSTGDSETGGLLQILDQFGLQTQNLSRINNNRKEKKMLF